MLIVDCRPGDAFRAGHIPGSAHAEPERDLSDHPVDPAHGGRHPLPGDDRLAAVFGRLGIDRDTFVLAVDEGSGWAARCWWLLRHLGHDDAGTFDLRGYEGPLHAGEAPRAEPLAPLEARPRADDVIETTEILERLGDPTLVLLDARSPERWRGDVEPLDPVAGRIPGARNAYFLGPVPEDVLDAPELAVYCGSGVSAAPVVQRLVLAGRDDVRLYPGSFSEWCRTPDCPIETGDPR